MEAAGLTVGVLALASLFNSCMDCFDYIDSARNYERDIEILSAKLVIQKFRLESWGEHVGVGKPDETAALENILKRTPTLDAQITLCLGSIERLFTDSEQLCHKYGMNVRSLGVSSGGLSSLSHGDTAGRVSKLEKCLQFRPRVPNDKSSAKTGQKLSWAIGDKERFITLIEDVRDFIDGLYHVIPVIKQRQKRFVERRLRSNGDAEILELAQNATEDDYPEWSDTASELLVERLTENSARAHVARWLDTVSIGDAFSQRSVPSPPDRQNTSHREAPLRRWPGTKKPTKLGFKSINFTKILIEASQPDPMEDSKFALQKTIENLKEKLLEVDYQGKAEEAWKSTAGSAVFDLIPRQRYGRKEWYAARFNLFLDAINELVSFLPSTEDHIWMVVGPMKLAISMQDENISLTHVSEEYGEAGCHIPRFSLIPKNIVQTESMQDLLRRTWIDIFKFTEIILNRYCLAEGPKTRREKRDLFMKLREIHRNLHSHRDSLEIFSLGIRRPIKSAGILSPSTVIKHSGNAMPEPHTPPPERTTN